MLLLSSIKVVEEIQLAKEDLLQLLQLLETDSLMELVMKTGLVAKIQKM